MVYLLIVHGRSDADIASLGFSAASAPVSILRALLLGNVVLYSPCAIYRREMMLKLDGSRCNGSPLCYRSRALAIVGLTIWSTEDFRSRRVRVDLISGITVRALGNQGILWTFFYFT